LSIWNGDASRISADLNPNPEKVVVGRSNPLEYTGLLLLIATESRRRRNENSQVDVVVKDKVELN
jgi:hypothetical protein